MWSFGDTPSSDAPDPARPSGYAPQPGDRPVPQADYPTPTPPQGLLGSAAAWWSDRSTGEKAALVLVPLLLVGAVAIELGTRKKQRAYAANRSRRRRRAAHNPTRRGPPRGFREDSHTGQLACPHRDVTVCEKCAGSHPAIVEIYGQHFWVPTIEERRMLSDMIADTKKKKWARGRKNPRRRARRNPSGACAGVPYCHGSPPAKARRLGATRPEHYAYPEGFKFPLYFSTRAVSIAHIKNATSRCVQHCAGYPPQVRDQIARNIDKARLRYGMAPHRWPWRKVPAHPAKVIRMQPRRARAGARRRRAAN